MKNQKLQEAEEYLKAKKLGFMVIKPDPEDEDYPLEEIWLPDLLADFALQHSGEQPEGEEALEKEMHYAFMAHGDGWEMDPQLNDIYDHAIKAAKNYAKSQKAAWLKERGELVEGLEERLNEMARDGDSLEWMAGFEEAIKVVKNWKNS